MKPLNTDTAERVGDIQTSATSNKQTPAQECRSWCTSAMNHYAALGDLLTQFFNLISGKCLYIIRGKPQRVMCSQIKNE